jgi:uncharacterized RDD family membrane protein YckC
MYDQNPYVPPAAEILDRIAQPDVEETELAGRGTRLLAAVIDGVLMAALFFPWAFFTPYWEEAMKGEVSMAYQAQGVIVGLLVYLVLNGYHLARHGQTLGKRVMGIRIVSAHDGQILPLWKVLLLRQLSVALIAQIPWIGPLLGLANPLLIFREDRRCLHDLIAGSKVIRVSD